MKTLAVALLLPFATPSFAASVDEKIDRCLAYFDRHLPHLTPERLAEVRSRLAPHFGLDETPNLPSLSDSLTLSEILNGRDFMTLSLIRLDETPSEDLLRERMGKRGYEKRNVTRAKPSLLERGLLTTRYEKMPRMGHRYMQDVFQRTEEGIRAVIGTRDFFVSAFEWGKKERDSQEIMGSKPSSLRELASPLGFAVLSVAAKPVTFETIESRLQDNLGLTIDQGMLKNTLKRLRLRGWLRRQGDSFGVSKNGEQAWVSTYLFYADDY